MTQPGDFRFKDLNGDHKRYSRGSQHYCLGSPLPKFVFGIPLSVGYKDFDLNIFFQGQTGNKIFNVMDYYLYNAAEGNVYADIRDKAWTTTNIYASVPQLIIAMPHVISVQAISSYKTTVYATKRIMPYLTFPNKIISKMKISTFSLSLTAYNLLTFTGYDGFDPEVGKI